MNDIIERIQGLSPARLKLLALDLQAELDALKNKQRDPIAIIGIGNRFPGGATDPDSFWSLLSEGKDAITEIPPDRWDVDYYFDPDPDVPGKMATRWGGFMDDVREFDAELFGIVPREAATMDPQQRILLETTWAALEDSALAADRLRSTRTGVYVGMCSSDYFRQLMSSDINTIDMYVATGNSPSVASGRISYILGLDGPSMTIDTACSSSLVAVHLACQSLWTGETDLALAAGVNLILSPEGTVSMSQAGAMALDGRCKSFDSSGDGFVRSEGCGVVVLKRLSEALDTGDPIRAVIRGSAVNQDGRSNGLTAPSGVAQEDVIRSALQMAGVSPGDVNYLECHGTGTPLGDPIEVQAIGAAFGKNRTLPVNLGSLKSNLGHMEAAAGIGGLIKTVLSLEKRQIPPSLHFSEPNPHIPWDSLPVKVVAELTPWPEVSGTRIAGVNAFGFSGTNAHVVVEQAPELAGAENEVDRPAHLLVLSAKNDQALHVLVERYRTLLESKSVEDVGNLCYTAATGRSHQPKRLSIVGKSLGEIQDKMQLYLEGDPLSGVVTGTVPGSGLPRVVFLYTGQGSQYPGMARGLYESQPTFRDALDRCAYLLQPYMERSLVDLIYSEQVESSLLDETFYTQVAGFSIQYSLTELWRSWGVRANAIIGHSVGEIAAACAVGVFSLEDGIRLIAERGRLLQSLSADGAMAAIRLDQDSVQQMLDPVADEVVIAAYNGPDNVVISGRRETLEKKLAEFEEKGIETSQLAVSQAFHSPLVEPILDEFRKVASQLTFNPPRATFFSTVTGREISAKELCDPEYWVQHMRRPVRFCSAVEAAYDREFDLFLELGAHTTLVAMGAACLPDNQCTWLPSLRRGIDDWERILGSLAELYVRGVEIDWPGFDRDYTRRRLRLPIYPFQRRRYWTEVASSRSSGGDHIVGRAISLPNGEVWHEVEIDLDSHPYLEDHRVHGAVIVPAPLFLAMICESVSLAKDDSVTVNDLEILEPLAIRGEDSLRIQLRLQQIENNLRDFEIYSVTGSDESATKKWTLHARGSVGQSAGLESATTLEKIRGRCPDEHSGSEHYSRLRDIGVDFGPLFQGVVEYRRGTGEALAEVGKPIDLIPLKGAELFHPAILDSCLHSIAMAMPEMDDKNEDRDEISDSTDTYLVVGFGRFTLGERLPEQLWSHARVTREADTRSLEATVDIYDESSRLVARFEDIRLRRVSSDALARMAGRDISRWLYQVDWREQHNEQLISAASMPFPVATELAEPLELQMAALATQHGLEDYKRLIDDLQLLSRHFIVCALREIGWNPSVGDRVDVSDLIVRLGVVDPHRRLFGRLLEILNEDKILERSECGWKVVSELTIPDIDSLRDDLLTRYQGFTAEIDFLDACGRELGKFLSGHRDPLDILFPGGSVERVTRLTQDSPAALVYNTLVRNTFETLVDRLPSERKLRILEVGAGTGGTTSSVLPVLPPDRTDYVFTDVSPLFLSEARNRFDRYPFVRYQIFDVESDPKEQGFRRERFDIILAANVIHATRDIGDSLSNLGQLLAPGGVLALLEGTGPQRWVDLTFGLTEGWWRFDDFDIRTSHPLLSRKSWQQILSANGYGPIAIVPPDEGSSNDVSHQAVILASGPSCIAEPCVWVVLGDGLGMAESIAEFAREADEACFLVRPGNTLEWLNEYEVRLDEAEPEQFDQLLARVTAFAGKRRVRIVHAWGSSSESVDEPTLEALEASVANSCRSALHLAQAAASYAEAAPLELWFTTHKAVSVMDSAPELAQVPLWGFCRSLATEHPELWGGIIDVDGKGIEAAQLVWDEIRSDTGEDQIVFRQGSRLLGRLTHLGLETGGSGAEQAVSVREGTSLVTGGLGGMGLYVAKWLAENGSKSIVLTSRREPSSEATAAIEVIESIGARVEVMSGDVADEKGIGAVLDRINQELPPLMHVFHLAGSFDDRVIRRQNWDRFEKVLAPKVSGAWNLHQLTADMELRNFVIYASGASFLGPAGLANYAAANAFLDALAQYRRRLGLPAISIDWGPWEKIGMADAVGETREDQWAQGGFETMSAEEGLEAMARLMREGPAQVAVLPVDWSVYVQRFGSVPPFYLEVIRESQPHSQTRGGASEGGGVRALRERLEAASAEDRQELLTEVVRNVAMEILGFDRSQMLDPEQGLFDLGMDSLTSLELRNRLQLMFGKQLQATIAFDHPTVNALVAYLAREVIDLDFGQAKTQQEPAETGPENQERGDMSEVELAELLADKLKKFQQNVH